MKPDPATRRLALTLALLLLLFGAAMGLLAVQWSREREAVALQRLSSPLAGQIVAHWPVLRSGEVDPADPQALERVIEQLMHVNPGIQVYTLDAEGRVQHYLGEPGMVRTPQVDLAPVRAFLAGRGLPLRGSDPMAAPGGAEQRLFSAAMFPARAGDARPPGYLYVVLDGPARQQAASHAADEGRWPLLAAWLGGAGLLTLSLGVLLLRRQAGQDRERLRHEQERLAAATHREHIAQLAHDLRTPLTALHGQIEALPVSEPRRRALAQSERLGRLTQQLFELATLEAAQELAQRERFALDELVSDTVRKFGDAAELAGAAPGRIEVQGDWQLVERALSNLIDNALRHAGRVRVSLRREGRQAHVEVHDDGPGLPAEWLLRLHEGQSLRGLRRQGGGLGGLGLAIAQRVAQLHGGHLRPTAGPGTRLALALPLD